MIFPNIPPAIFEAFRRLFGSLQFRFGAKLPATRDQLVTSINPPLIVRLRKELLSAIPIGKTGFYILREPPMNEVRAPLVEALEMENRRPR